MKKPTLILLLLAISFAAPSYLAVAEYDLDLQTLIAGIKHFDAKVTSGKGEFVYEHYLGGMDTRTYDFTFKGTTFETAQIRVDNSKDTTLTEMYDGERQWEIYEVKANLFSVDILPAESKLINKAKPELPLAVKQQLQAHGISFSDDFRIETVEESSYLKMIDNVTRHSYYIYYTEEYFSLYTPRLEYGVRSQCVIHAHLDPRYWMTCGKATPNSYLMVPLWKVLESHESKILRTEILNGEETYVVSVKYPRTESLKLWIATEKGFRLVKLQNIWESQNESDLIPFEKGAYYLKERVLRYREYLPGIWFPEKVEETINLLLAGDPQKKGDRIGKTTLQFITCELNTDVVERFQLDVPEETPVYDYGLAKERPFSELTQISQ